MPLPSEEEPKPSGFAAYPRVGPLVRRDPDPIPSDRWLAYGAGLLCVVSSLSSLTRGPFVSGLWILGVFVMAFMLLAYFAAGRGYRVGFGIVMLLGLFQIWGTYLQWRHGALFHGSWLIHIANFYSAFFALYCAARFFRLWPR